MTVGSASRAGISSSVEVTAAYQTKPRDCCNPLRTTVLSGAFPCPGFAVSFAPLKSASSRRQPFNPVRMRFRRQERVSLIDERNF